VFQEDFPTKTNDAEPGVGELLSFEGVKLMDRQNVYVQEGVDQLGRQIKDTIKKAAGPQPAIADQPRKLAEGTDGAARPRRRASPEGTA
jgi:hypothetical protein